jgi:tetratricopeptide (TPR) repeat protein
VAVLKELYKSPAVRSCFPVVLLMGILLVVVGVLFAPSLKSGFADDSRGQILVGDFIHQPGNLLPAVTFQVLGMDVLDFNRPVALVSLMFDSLVWGRNPFGYHLTNIVLHLIVTGMTFLLIRHVLTIGNTTREGDLSRQNLSAFLAALLFSVHPLVTEAVCEPSNRKDLLTTVFGLAALFVAARHSPATRRGDALRILLSTFLTLLAVGSKELGAAVPVILFLYWFLFRRREPVKFWAGTILSSAVVVVVFLTARFALAHPNSEIFLGPAVYPGGSLAQALLVQPRILALYIANILWPVHLCADYNIYSLRYFPLPLSLFLVALIGALLAWWSARDRRALFGVGIIAAALLPVCNLVPIFRPAADRYLYLPLIGVALLVAIVLDHPWLSQKPFRRRTAAVSILLIACLLAQVTLQREWVWSSSLNLWQDTLRRNPSSLDAYVNLPVSLLRAGRLQEAKVRYEAAFKTPYADSPWLWAGYAIVLNRLGYPQEAEQAASRALILKPDILETDKMVRTMQADRDFENEFIHIADTQHQPTPVHP